MNQLEEQFTNMLEKNKKEFYKLAISYVKTEANALDMMGEATYQALVSLPGVREPKYLKTWYYRILINSCKNFLKKSRNLVYGDELLDQLSSQSDVHEEWLDLHDAVHDLPPKYREVIQLKYFNQLSIEEITRVLHRNPNTVKSLLRRGIAKLQLSMRGVLDG
jgi:RNA polymerase sigma-70 factor (ECF subfamily)